MYSTQSSLIFSICSLCTIFATAAQTDESPYNSTCKPIYVEDNIWFKFYNNKTGGYETITIKNKVPKDVYNPKYKTKLIMTGQYTNYLRSTPMVEAYKMKPLNIIVIDWSAYSACEHCDITTRIVSPLSTLISRFISERLYKIGTKPASLHMIGHSFGAHIVCLASQLLNDSKAGRVTGLDPGQGIYNSSPAKYRFNRYCAIFTDTVRTNAGRDGMFKSIAEVDFYPNGGVRQPHCANESSEDVADFCAHQVAIEYFAESISTENADNNDKKFFSIPCGKYYKNLTTDIQIPMGDPVPHNAHGDYCLNTNAESPYAQGYIKGIHQLDMDPARLNYSSEC